jgi:hypothetical protein
MTEASQSGSFSRPHWRLRAACQTCEATPFDQFDATQALASGAIEPCGAPQPSRGGASNLLSSFAKLFCQVLSSFSLVLSSFSKHLFGGFWEYQ